MPSVSWEQAVKDVAEYEANKGRSKGAQRQIIPEGFYDGALVSIESKRSKAGAPQLKFDLSVDGAPLSTWMTFTTRSTQYALSDLVKLGLDPNDSPVPVEDKENDWYEIDTDALAEQLDSLLSGKELWVSVIVEESEEYGRQSRVKRFGVASDEANRVAEMATGGSGRRVGSVPASAGTDKIAF